MRDKYVIFMRKSVSFLLLFVCFPYLSLHASAPAKTIVTYMDQDSPHQIVLYNNSKGKTILVVDCVEYPDESGLYTDTLLLDDESRIIRIASLRIINDHKVLSEPIVVKHPTTDWNLDDIVTMPFFQWTDYETIESDEQSLVSHYEKLRYQMLLSDSEKAIFDLKSASWLTWIGLVLMLLGLLAGIATLTMKLSPKSIRIIGGYVVALSLWGGLYPVWSFLNKFFEPQYTVTFVILFTSIIAVYCHAVMNRVESDHTLTNKQVKSSFIPAFFVSLVVCTIIGYQYAWWGALGGYMLALFFNNPMINRPNRCEECRRKQTLKDYDEHSLGTKVYETSKVEGSPEVYRVYREVTYEVYVKRFRCSACGHIQEDSMKKERLINSKAIRREYLFTKKQRPAFRASVSSSDAFPKVYEIIVNGHSYTLTQRSKYSEIDYDDQYGGWWEKWSNGFKLREKGINGNYY